MLLMHLCKECSWFERYFKKVSKMICFTWNTIHQQFITKRTSKVNKFAGLRKICRYGLLSLKPDNLFYQNAKQYLWSPLKLRQLLSLYVLGNKSRKKFISMFLQLVLYTWYWIYCLFFGSNPLRWCTKRVF